MLVLLARPVTAAGRIVTFRAEDGRALNALAYEPSQRPSPAVVLVPMLGRPKEDWDAIGQRLADANILAVAIDLPGVSDPGDSRVLGAWSGDVRAAITYLNSRPDVRSGRSVSRGRRSAPAWRLSRQRPRERSARSCWCRPRSITGASASMPPSNSTRGPALLVASAGDPYASRSVRELAKDAPGVRDTRFSSVTAHGTLLLARDPDMVNALVEWFQRTLGVN